MPEITLTFPDGAKRAVEKGITGKALAEGISKSLAKKAVAISLDGKLADLADPIDAAAEIKIITRTDPEALELIRHDCAHVMAEAVQSLWPKVQVTIGPVIENGFYYDFAKQEPFHPDDLARIEKRMHEIIQKNASFTKEVWSRKQAREFFKKNGEMFKVELVDAIPEGEDLKIYKQGEWLDLCRGPHMASTGQVGKAFKLQKIAGAYWRGDSNKPMLQRIYGTAWASGEDLQAYLTMLEEAEKRDHRRLGARWICSTSRRRRREPSSGTPRAGPCSRIWSSTCAGARTRPVTARSTHQTCWTARFGSCRVIGRSSARTCSSPNGG